MNIILTVDPLLPGRLPSLAIRSFSIWARPLGGFNMLHSDSMCSEFEDRGGGGGLIRRAGRIG